MSKIEVYLTKDMRENLLDYEINHRDMYYEDYMYYMTTSENEILRIIIDSLLGDIDVFTKKEMLEVLGFHYKDVELMNMYDIDVRFTDKNKCYIQV